MSVFNRAISKCGKCGNEHVVQLAASVNAARRPDLRAAILDGSFQAITCEKCKGPLRLPAHLTYLDVDHGHWILVEDPSNLPQWVAGEGEARELFDGAFGAGAPEAAREIGSELTPRLVFGWPALREKLIAGDLSMGDVPLELLKVALLRDVPEPPDADQTELRLVGGDDQELHLNWIETATEQPISALTIPFEIYRDIDEQPEDWIALRRKFEGALFVDMKRLVVG